MIMETKEFIRRKRIREQHEKEVEDKRIDKLVLKKMRQKNKHLTHIWMIEEYEYCDIKKEMVWNIAGDSEGQYRIFCSRAAARFWVIDFAQSTHWETGKKRRLRIRKYVREE